MRIVYISGYINENGLSAGANGYVSANVTIPTGYKSIGIMSISLGHPGGAGGMVLTAGIGMNLTGTQTIYISYYTPNAISNGAHTDYSIIVMCIKSSSSLA